MLVTSGQLKILNMTRFQLILPVDSHDVTKNMTGHRMHVEAPQIYQMIRHINSFRQKLIVWPGKSIHCTKTPQIRLFLCARNWVTRLQNFLWSILGSTNDFVGLMNFHLGHAWRNQMSPLLDCFYTLLWRTRKYHLFLHLLCKEFDIRQKRSKCIFMKDPLKKKTTSSLSIEDAHKLKFVEVHKKCIS